MKTLTLFFLLALPLFAVTVRLKDEPPSSVPASDDYLVTDGTTYGVRSLPANYYLPMVGASSAAPQFAYMGVGQAASPIYGVSIVAPTTANGALTLKDHSAQAAITFIPNLGGGSVNLISSDYFSGSGYFPLSLSARQYSGDFQLQTNGNISIGFALTVAGTSLFGTTSDPSSTVAGSRLGSPLATTPVISAGTITASTTMLTFINGNGPVGSIVTSGSATAYNTSSDRRLKENIRDYTNVGSVIDAIRPRSFDWKVSGKPAVGFIAQELYKVAPYAVTKGDDDPTVIHKQWQVDYSKLVPVMMAEIKELRARVAALESAQAAK